MICPLCESSSKLFFKNIYYKCECCKAIFKDTNYVLKGEDEKNIYEQHKNIASDIRYQNFLSPITNSVINDFHKGSVGLDFGCGKDSAIIYVLKENSYEMFGYDLFYKDDRELLDKKYDFITSSETIEHFQNPKKEFELFDKLLNKNGALYLMTLIYDEKIDFEKWYYKDDPTHIFLFQKETFEYIKNKFSYKKLVIEDRLIKLYK